MVAPSVQVDTREFDAAFKRYTQVSQRSFAEICNKKAAMIATGAIRHTKRASRDKMESELGRFVTVTEQNGRGKTVKRRRLSLSIRKGHSAPLAELIINKRRGRAGKKGLAGAEMASAARKMIAGRLRSIGFLASGWLASIKILLAALKDRSGIKLDRAVKWYGKPKGTANPAKAGWNPIATIVNTVNGGGKVPDYITAGVQKAMSGEARSMNDYVERKLAKDADSFNRS